MANRHSFEAYLKGEGILEDLISGRLYTIKPGTLYAVNEHDRHRLGAASVVVK